VTLQVGAQQVVFAPARLPQLGAIQAELEARGWNAGGGERCFHQVACAASNIPAERDTHAKELRMAAF
jgi:hypothetical protein